MQHVGRWTVTSLLVVQDVGQAEAASHALQVAVLVNAASVQANQGQFQQVHELLLCCMVTASHQSYTCAHPLRPAKHSVSDLHLCSGLAM